MSGDHTVEAFTEWVLGSLEKADLTLEQIEQVLRQALERIGSAPREEGQGE